tara:strand:+ start:4171 stop:5025 length:855 start_codon:yes stop_codon:yes gene_type:complete
MAEKDRRLVLLIGDISHHLLRDFESKFPDRFYNAGICEQSIVSMAAGLAAEGFKPVVHTIAPFCVERAFEQIKIDACYQELPITIVSVGSSFDYAHLGCTHHCYEDTSILRTLPNMDVFVPGNSHEFKRLFESTWESPRSSYFKLSKSEHSQNTTGEPYRFEVLNRGSSSTALFVNGHLLEEVYKIPGIENYTIVYSPTIEPISKQGESEILDILRHHKKIVSIEENCLIGGFGDKIADISFNNNIAILNKKIGIPRIFLDKYGTAKDHREFLGLTAKEMKKVL